MNRKRSFNGQALLLTGLLITVAATLMRIIHWPYATVIRGSGVFLAAAGVAIMLAATKRTTK